MKWSCCKPTVIRDFGGFLAVWGVGSPMWPVSKCRPSLRHCWRSGHSSSSCNQSNPIGKKKKRKKKDMSDVVPISANAKHRVDWWHSLIKWRLNLPLAMDAEGLHKLKISDLNRSATSEWSSLWRYRWHHPSKEQQNRKCQPKSNRITLPDHWSDWRTVGIRTTKYTLSRPSPIHQPAQIHQKK